MKKIKKSIYINITGYVTSTDWDKGGNVVQVAIETEDFEKYVIADNKMGRELFDIIDKKVKVNGILAGEHFDGSEIIFIKNYKIIN